MIVDDFFWAPAAFTLQIDRFFPRLLSGIVEALSSGVLTAKM
jgi:hypothetical protein